MQHTLRTKLAKAVSVLALGCALACATAPEASADPQELTMYNKAQKTINRIFIAPAGHKAWGDNTLPNGAVIKSGEDGTVSLDTGETRFWDIYVGFTNKEGGMWLNLDMAMVTGITISYSNGRPDASIDVVGR